MVRMPSIGDRRSNSGSLAMLRAMSLLIGDQVRRRATARLLLEVPVGERLPVSVADDETGVRLFGDPSAGRPRQVRRTERPGSFKTRSASRATTLSTIASETDACFIEKPPRFGASNGRME